MKGEREASERRRNVKVEEDIGVIKGGNHEEETRQI